MIIGARRRRVLVPIPHRAEVGQEVGPLDLLHAVQEILQTAPDPMSAVVSIHKEVSTWRLIQPDGEAARLVPPVEPPKGGEG